MPVSRRTRAPAAFGRSSPVTSVASNQAPGTRTAPPSLDRGRAPTLGHPGGSWYDCTFRQPAGEPARGADDRLQPMGSGPGRGGGGRGGNRDRRCDAQPRRRGVRLRVGRAVAVRCPRRRIPSRSGSTSGSCTAARRSGHVGNSAAATASHHPKRGPPDLSPWLRAPAIGESVSDDS
jgi:hypothetical protein